MWSSEGTGRPDPGGQGNAGRAQQRSQGTQRDWREKCVSTLRWWSALSSPDCADRVRADEVEAGRREITAVPTFLVADRFVIPGAQSPESMLATLRRAWQRTAGGPPA